MIQTNHLLEMSPSELKAHIAHIEQLLDVPGLLPGQIKAFKAERDECRDRLDEIEPYE